MHDYFAEHRYTIVTRDTVPRISSDDADEPKTDPSLQDVEATPISGEVLPLRRSKDDWALQYISIYRIQPLVEALDDDVSSFVTISEVNVFTTARPEHWT
jgi:hypothetical protein